MTELERMAHAKRYIDDLAQGMDPLTGHELPGDTVLNHVRLARCFFYVSGVLQQVIENGGEVGAKPRKEKKAPFAITRAEVESVPVSQTPAYISHFCRAISDAAGTDEKNMRPLSHRTITDWLCEKGFLETVEQFGKKKKRVTPLGESIGLREEEREGQYGGYVATTYSQEAQQFILDNLEAILSGGGAEAETP